MKLRNKQSGEIKEFVLFDGKELQGGVTLEILTKEWEDVITYEPPLLSLDKIGLEVALGDYHDGGKHKFSWDEAMEIPKKVGNGWRLPTMIEWTKICNEVAATEDGGYDVRKFKKALGFEESSGLYWSSTVYSAISAYTLNYNMDGIYRNLYPQDDFNKGNIFAVRLVRGLR